MMADEYYFDEDAADLVCLFFETMLFHVEGPLAGLPFSLERWERDILREVFGWKRASDGRRRYRFVYIELPRGNGKSTICAGLALFMLVADGEVSAKVYGAAADKNQAALVFEYAEKMVGGSPSLAEEVKPFRNRTMEHAASGSKYVVLSADAYSKHGLNPHCIVFDELHAQPNRELYDVLKTAMGKRGQPMMVMITTAGYDRNSICWEIHEYARQVQQGIVDDPTFYPAIWAAEAEDDWTSPAVWRKANPNYGVSVREDFLRQECVVALASPAYQNTFRRLYLNQWVQQESRFLPMERWDGCNRALPELAGRTCYAGLDLASTTDIAAMVLLFPPLEDAQGEAGGEPAWLLPFFWIPQENMRERERRDRVPYGVWVRDGLVEATPGNVIDYRAIRGRILELAGRYDVREVAYDPWNATQLAVELEGDGVRMVEMRQGFASLSAPTKELLRLVLAGQLGHGGNPVLRWMADNVAAKQDPAGNVKPDKSKSTNRIDGIVASIMAVGRAMVADPKGDRSVYEERGVREL